MSAKGILGGEIIAAVIVIALVWGYSHHKKTEEKTKVEKVAAEKYIATHPPAPPAPPKVSGVTPTEITADYGFSLETDAPIMVQYPEEKPFLFTPGGPCNQLPQPKHSGPKKFWDPKDPKNGHIYFRLYRGVGKC